MQNPIDENWNRQEAIEQHITKWVGPVEGVFTEKVSDAIRVDIYWVKPSKKHPFHTLVTCGMSDRPMSTPDDLEVPQHCEVCILLPEDWKISTDEAIMKKVFAKEENYWPILWLKNIARFPHDFKTWIGYGHTIPNGNDALPFAKNTELACMLLYPSLELPSDFLTLTAPSGDDIEFHALYPIYKEEMLFKIEHGLDALIDKFEQHNILNVLDISRINTCKIEKKWWQIF